MSLCLSAFACSDGATEAVLEGTPSDIIGGQSATSTALNHTGALLYGCDDDTMACYGDSGGPLMKYVAGRGWETYGVVSGGFSSNRSVCDFGSVFATFGPEVIDFLTAAKQWEDPCGDVGTEGTCDGNVAINCVTILYDGIRTLEEKDCTEIGKTCVILEEGSFCGIVPSVSEDAAPAMSKQESDSTVEAAVKNAFYYQR